MMGGKGINIGDLDTYLGPADGSGPCIPETIDETDVNRGIITDENGCLYVRDFNGSPQYMKKWCPDGAGGYTLEWQTDITTAAAAGFPSSQGGDGGYGLTYCEDNGYIYTAGNDDDCVSVYDATTGDYVIQGFPNPGGTFAKEITISKECCITNTNIPPTQLVFCESEQPDLLLLADYLPCEGIVCAGTWTEGSNTNNAFAFDNCDNSIEPQGIIGCATYNFTQACGPATISVEICLEECLTPCEAPGCDPVPSEEVCSDGSDSLTLSCATGVTDVIWYNSAGVQVGTGCDLIVDNSAIGTGVAGESECFYYEAIDSDGCSGDTCCPIIVSVIDCCGDVPCAGITITRN